MPFIPDAPLKLTPSFVPDEEPKKKTFPPPRQYPPIDTMSPIFEQVDTKQYPIIGGAQDVAGQFGTAYLNQFGYGLPEALLKKAHLTLPKPATKTGKAFEVAGGISGAVMSPLTKLGLGSVRLASKVPLATKVLSKTVPRLMAEGGVLGALYTPPNDKGDIVDLSGRGKQAGLGAALGLGANKVIKTLTGENRLAQGKKLIDKATKAFRDVLRPTQGEIKNVEIRGGKNIDDFYKIAAQDKLPLKVTADKKLDTKDARIIVEAKLKQLNGDLDAKLEAIPNKFDLSSIRAKAKSEIEKRVKNSTDLKTALAEVDTFIDDEIARRGNIVTAKGLNEVKQGMWAKGYEAMKPTSKKTARMIGHIAKEELEGALPGELKTINDATGKYATLVDLLRNAQGRVIKGGRLGMYFSQLMGGLVGGAVGSAIPIPGLGTAGGAVAGQFAGKKFGQFLTSPERISASAGKTMAKGQKLVEGITPLQKKISSLAERAKAGYARQTAINPPQELMKSLKNQRGSVGFEGSPSKLSDGNIGRVKYRAVLESLNNRKQSFADLLDQSTYNKPLTPSLDLASRGELLKSKLLAMEELQKNPNSLEIAQMIKDIDTHLDKFAPKGTPTSSGSLLSEKPIVRAKFIGYQDIGEGKAEPMFNVVGDHPDNGSSFFARSIKERGIEVPKIPSFSEWKQSKTKGYTQPSIEKKETSKQKWSGKLKDYEKDGRNLLEWENENLTIPEIKRKLEIAIEGNEDPSFIKIIKDDLNKRIKWSEKLK